MGPLERVFRSEGFQISAVVATLVFLSITALARRSALAIILLVIGMICGAVFAGITVIEHRRRSID